MSTNNEAQQVLIEARKARVQAKLDESTERAATVTHEILDSEDVPPIVRLNAAKDILDRGGFKPVERQIVTHILPKPILDLDAIINEPVIEKLNEPNNN